LHANSEGADAKILRFVSKEGTPSMTQIERGTGLARQTVSVHVHALEERRLLSHSTGKFPPTRQVSLTETGKLLVREMELLDEVKKKAQAGVEEEVVPAYASFIQEKFLLRPLALIDRDYLVIGWLGRVTKRGTKEVLEATIMLEKMMEKLDPKWIETFNKLHRAYLAGSRMDYRPSDSLRRYVPEQRHQELLNVHFGDISRELDELQGGATDLSHTYEKALMELVLSVRGLLDEYQKVSLGLSK
jgi:DNA-binding MarR family transcriptional regulator